MATDKHFIKLVVDKDFPSYYLNSTELPTIIRNTVGKLLANETQSDVTVILPPSTTFNDRRVKIPIVVDKQTYLLLKTCNTKMYLMGYAAEIDTTNQDEENDNVSPERLNTNIIVPGILNLKLGKLPDKMA